MSHIHNWLLTHVIWQNILINLGVGVFLLIVGTRWKVIVAFCKVPPQRLSAWITKARINSEISKLRMLRRAKADIVYAIPRFALYLGCLFLVAAYAIGMLIFIALEIHHPTTPVLGLPSHVPLTRGTHVLAAMWPMLITFFFAFRMIRFAAYLAHSEKYQAAILRNIRRLAEKLAASTSLNGASNTIRRVDLGIYLPGMKVRHPRFGEGVVKEVSPDPLVDDRLLVFFPSVGLKRLASRYARLEII